MKKYLLALCLILISQLASGQVLTSPGGTTFTGGTVSGATTFANNATSFGDATGPVVLTFLVTGTDPTLTISTGAYLFPASTYLNFGATAGTTGYGWFDSAGTLKFKHSGGAWAALSAPSTSGNIMKSDGTDWTSSNSLSIATLDMTSSTSSVPWLVNASTATVTTEGAAHWESDTDILSIGDGATKVSLDFTANTIYTFPSVTASLAPLTSPAFTTPTLGAATATSVLATGIVDGTAPIVITATTANYQVGATYKSGYTFLNPTSSSGANSALLPTAAAGLQYCIGNYTAKTGTLTIKTAVGTQTIDLDGVMTANTGAVQATAVAGNLACFVGLDGSVWKAIPTKGVWTRIARP